MKKISTILLLVFIFLQTFSSFVIQAEYFLNKDYIARVLCINKAKPKMHCNGKCYLAKKLQEQEGQEKQATNPKKEKFEVQPYFLPGQFSLTSVHIASSTKFYDTEEIIPFAFPHAIFHPPAV